MVVRNKAVFSVFILVPFVPCLFHRVLSLLIKDGGGEEGGGTASAGVEGREEKDQARRRGAETGGGDRKKEKEKGVFFIINLSKLLAFLSKIWGVLFGMC